jgi:hypothetical protein
MVIPGIEVEEKRAALVVGSRARTDHPADRWSDLDLLLFTTAPDAYAADDPWRALSATLELFRWLARETAERWGYPYPTRTDRLVTEWLLKMGLWRIWPGF